MSRWNVLTSLIPRHFSQMINMAQRENLLPFFLGAWTFNRQIESLKDGSTIGEVHNGTASFCELASNDYKPSQSQESATQVLYREKGQLRSDSFYSDFTRQYVYMFDMNSSVQVFHCSTASGIDKKQLSPLNKDVDQASFVVGDFFHDIEFTGDGESNQLKADSCKHLCAPDTYEGCFEITGESSFQSLWNVNGPQKCYSIKTSYTKINETK